MFSLNFIYFIQKVIFSKNKIGDILILKKGEICPADILLLDSSLVQEIEIEDSCNFNRREDVCYIDTRNIDGKMTPSLKKSTKLTKCKSKIK